MGVYLSQGSVLRSAPVKQRGGKTCTVEATATRAERKTGTKDRKAFRVMFLARFSGRRPCFIHLPCSDPGDATLVLPTARWRVPTPVAPLLGSLSCSRSSMSLWAQWSVRFFDRWIAGSLDRWNAGSLDRLAVAWIPWREVVLIKSWLDKNTDVHKPAGLPRMRETRICASRACRRRACRRRAWKKKKVALASP